jgi:flagellar biogenesis protein FliO
VAQTSSRRLRVAETVSLGEKRFVSIVQVDGAQFLIGGSATEIQLLANLNPQPGGMTATFPEEQEPA